MPVIAMSSSRLEAEKAKEALVSRGIPVKLEKAGGKWFISSTSPVTAQLVLHKLNLCRNPDLGNLSGVQPNPYRTTSISSARITWWEKYDPLSGISEKTRKKMARKGLII